MSMVVRLRFLHCIYVIFIVCKANSQTRHGSDNGDNGRCRVGINYSFVFVTIFLGVSMCMNYSKNVIENVIEIFCAKRNRKKILIFFAAVKCQSSHDFETRISPWELREIFRILQKIALG